MLRRIGFGLLVILFSFFIAGIIGNLLLCNSNTNVTCLFFHSEILNVSSGGLWWTLLPSTAYNLGYLLSVITLFEFVFAQAPYSIQGLMTGITILSLGLGLAIGYGVCQLVSVLFSSTHSWFIANISLFVVTALYLILFVSFSKCYVLRKRDDIVPIHLFAEEYLEKELEGRTRFNNERLQQKKARKEYQAWMLIFDKCALKIYVHNTCAVTEWYCTHILNHELSFLSLCSKLLSYWWWILLFLNRIVCLFVNLIFVSG